MLSYVLIVYCEHGDGIVIRDQDLEEVEIGKRSDKIFKVANTITIDIEASEFGKSMTQNFKRLVIKFVVGYRE